MAAADFEWTSPIGGNWAYMVKNQRLIGKFIKANAIKPVVIGPVVAREAGAGKAVFDLGIRGGMKAAHLHFGKQIYLLNEEQWAKFAGGIITDAKAKLAKAKTVGFEEGMVLGQVASSL